MPRSAFLGLKVIMSFPSFPLPLIFPTLMPTWASTPCPGCTICRNQAGFALLCTGARCVGSNWWWDHGTGAWGPELGDPGSTSSEGKVCAGSHVILLVEQRPQGGEWVCLSGQHSLASEPTEGALLLFFFYDASLKKTMREEFQPFVFCRYIYHFKRLNQVVKNSIKNLTALVWTNTDV